MAEGNVQAFPKRSYIICLGPPGRGFIHRSWALRARANRRRPDSGLPATGIVTAFGHMGKPKYNPDAERRGMAGAQDSLSMAGRRGPASRPGAARQSARVRHGRSCPAAGSVQEERDASSRETGRSARHTNERLPANEPRPAPGPSAVPAGTPRDGALGTGSGGADGLNGPVPWLQPTGREIGFSVAESGK